MANEFKVKRGLIVVGSGSATPIVDVQGSQGQLFSIIDSLSGSLFSVNDISGIPVIEAFSDTTVKMGQFNAEAIILSGSEVRIGNRASNNHSLTGSLRVSGSTVITGSFTVFTGSVVEFQVLQNGVRIGGPVSDTHVVSGSLIVTGSTLSQNGSNVVLTNQTSSLTTFTAFNSYTSSINTYTSSLNSKTSSFATTGSNTFIGNQIITGSLTLSSSADTELNVVGNSIFTGSLTITQPITGSLFGTASFATSASQASTASVSINSTIGSTTSNTTRYLTFVATGTGIRDLDINTTKFIVNAATGSMGINKSTIASGYNLDVSGSALISGSLVVFTGSGVEFQVTNTGVKIGNAPSDNHSVTGSLFLSGSLTSTGTLTAQTLVVQTITSSVIYSSGSNVFGNSLANTQVFTGSVNITGSLNVYNGEIFAGRIDNGSEGGQVSFGRALDNANGWYIDVYGDTSTPSLRFVDVSTSAVRMTISGSGGITMGQSLAVGSINPSATVGRIDASNDVVAFSTSDIRFKENINPIDNALDKLNKIGGYTFDWKTEEELVSLHGFKGHDVGVIAQEIESILPEVVTTRDSGYKAVKYEKIVPLLIQAIKEQQEQIKELQDIIKNK